MSTALLVLGALLAVASVVVLLLHTSSALLLSLAIAAAVFAGNTRYMGFPVPPDRLIMLAGLGLLLVGVERRELPFRLRFRVPHLLMVLLGSYVVLNALQAGTFQGEGIYGMLDRLSITGWVLFSVAPLVFFDRRRRNVFLVVIVALGAYLGFTALMEGIGLKALVFPRYINDATIGIHPDRARGPMTEAAGFGLALFQCGILAVLATREWAGRLARATAAAVAALCFLGVLFTLTRAVWIGALGGMLVVAVISPRWRRRIVPTLAVGGVVLFLVLTFSSALAGKVDERAGDQRPVWDRLNLADASLRAIEDNPAFGVGWRSFVGEGTQYFRLLPDIPQTGTTIDVHNALLSIGAELGLVGLVLWLAVIGSTVVAAMCWRPPPELEDWRLALVAVGVQWGVVAMFTPFAYTFSYFFVFALAGIVAAPRLIRRRPGVPGPLPFGAGRPGPAQPEESLRAPA